MVLLRYRNTRLAACIWRLVGHYICCDSLLTVKQMSSRVRDKYWSDPINLRYVVTSQLELSAGEISDEDVDMGVEVGFKSCVLNWPRSSRT